MSEVLISLMHYFLMNDHQPEKLKLDLDKLNSNNNNLINTISDKDLLISAMTKYNTLKKPQNYPNFYEQINNLPSGFSLNKNEFKKVITYIVSSDDEADTEAEYQIGLAQRNVITLIGEN